MAESVVLMELLKAAFLTLLLVVSVSSDVSEESHVSYNVAVHPSMKQYVIEYEPLSLHRYKRQANTANNGSTPSSSTADDQPTDVNGTTAPPVTKGETTTQAPTTPAPTTPGPTEQAPTESNGGSTSTSTLKPKVQEDNHQYYQSRILPESATEIWEDIINFKKHKTLSASHRTAVTINLSFPFRFYGHNVTNVTVATGGFLYTSPFLHQWLTATQYIAPLMANFDTRIGDSAAVYYYDAGDKFVVQWRNVVLQDQNSTGSFDFQAQLYGDGIIKFAYRQLPIPISQISNQNHPVKIGLSDAFYIDTYLRKQGIRRRTIYEYHRVSFHPDQIEQGTVIVMEPLPTCNTISNCKKCIKHQNVKFDCKWCGTVGRCSDGVDWHRSEWITKGCTKLNSTEGLCKNTDTFPVGAIVAIIFILLVVFGGIGVWIFYAYTHPTSASGIWLMEHRPSQMKAKISTMWKSSAPGGSKYAVESTA